MKKRKTVRGILIHCYQKTTNGALLFYTVSDYLAFFTILCIFAERYGVRILAVSLMPDHFHISLEVDDPRDLPLFISVVTQKYAKENNRDCHRTGNLFYKSFGSAVKNGAKKARTNLIYVGNNGVERQLCSVAEEYRWGFLPYSISDHPFSEPIVIRRASSQLRNALKEVEARHRDGKSLNYKLLQRLFRPLDKKEKLQLTDRLIAVYDIIDHKAAERFFDGYGNMIAAMHSNTGSEYDLNEVMVGRSDACYAQITNLLIKRLNLNDIHDLFLMQEDARFELLPMIQRETGAEPEQILKYLRLPYIKRKS